MHARMLRPDAIRVSSPLGREEVVVEGMPERLRALNSADAGSRLKLATMILKADEGGEEECEAKYQEGCG